MGDFNKSKIDEHEFRSNKYSLLLQNYVSNMKRNALAKFILKIFFFIIVMIVLGLLSYTFYYTIKCTINTIQEMIKSNRISVDMIATTMTPLISSFGTIIISLLKLPEIIAKYLFNPEEDKSAITIVENIQKYDISMYAMKHNIEEKLKNEKKDDNEWDELSPKNVTDPPQMTSSENT